MRSRKYNKRVEIWQTGKVFDGISGYTTSQTLITKQWAEVLTAGNNSRFVQRLNELGVTDPTLGVIINTRFRNDLHINPLNTFIKYGGYKYIIQNTATNTNLEGVEVQIIAVRESSKEANVAPAPVQLSLNQFPYTFDFNLS